MTDYINDKLSGDFGTALKAIGKVKTIFELTTSQESSNYVHCICLVETYQVILFIVFEKSLNPK